jgi:diacylglycerol kinase
MHSPKSPNFFKKRILSFYYAFKGIAYLIRSQPNAWIHLSAVVVVWLGFYLRLNQGEWLWVILAIGVVFSAEAFNTALEVITDMISPEIHPQAGKVKDLAAGAVLIIALMALIIGLLIFLPKISEIVLT